MFAIYRLLRQIIQRIRSLYWTRIVKFTVKSYGVDVKANGKTILNRSTILKNNVNFNGLRITGKGNVVIGNNFHSGVDCKLITQFHNYEGTKIPYDEKIIVKDIVIEDNVWLGDNVIILGGVTIQEGAIIQAGSVVVSDIEYCGIAGGHPAKVFKKRDIAHYEKLKQEGSYF